MRRVGQSNQIIEREYRLGKQIEWLRLLACLLLGLLLLCSNTQCKLHGEIIKHLPCSWEHSIILFYLYSDKSVITDRTSFYFNHLRINSWINLIKVWSPVHGVDSCNRLLLAVPPRDKSTLLPLVTGLVSSCPIKKCAYNCLCALCLCREVNYCLCYRLGW